MIDIPEICYQDAKSVFYCGDCLHIMPKYIPDKSVDTIVTSPPYNINKKYNKYKDNLPRKEYLSWMDRISDESFRVLKDKGSLFINFGFSSKDPWIDIDVMSVFRNQFEIQNRFTWIKSISIGDTTYGQFKPLNSDKFVNKTNEFLFHFTKDGDVKLDKVAIGVPFMHSSNSTRWSEKGKTKRCRGDSWFVPYETITSKSDRYCHPATFPVELPEKCIKLHGVNENLCVLDMFSGVGSTALAARRLGVKSISIDIDYEYTKSSIRRVVG